MRYLALLSILLSGCAHRVFVAQPANAPAVYSHIIGRSGKKYTAPTLEAAIRKCVQREHECRLEYVK